MKTIAKFIFSLILVTLISMAAFAQTASELVTRAAASIEKTDYDSAITDLTQAIKLQKKYAMAYALRGDAYLLKSHVDLALTDYDKAIKLDPKNSEFYFKRGMAYVKSPAATAATVLADLSKAIELDPTNENALRERGLRYYVTNKPEDRTPALADLERAVKIDSMDAAAWAPIGRLYVQLNNAEKALEAYRAYIALKPEDPYAYVERGQIYEFQKKYDLAIADYTVTIRILPKDVIGYANRGDAYFKANMLRPALSDYNKSIELSPKYSSSYSERGQVFEAQGKYDLAIKDYQKALEIDSYNAVAKARLDGAIEKHNTAVANFDQLTPEFLKLLAAYNVYAQPLNDKFFHEFADLDEAQQKLPQPDTKMMCGKLVVIKDLLKNTKTAFVPIKARYEQGKLAGFTAQLIFVETMSDDLADAEQYLKEASANYKCGL